MVIFILSGDKKWKINIAHVLGPIRRKLLSLAAEDPNGFSILIIASIKASESNSGSLRCYFMILISSNIGRKLSKMSIKIDQKNDQI